LGYARSLLDINIQDEDKNTLLIYASLNNHYDMAKLLLDNGANPNLRPNKHTENAYLVAKRLNYTKIANLLEPLSTVKSRHIEKSIGDDYKQMCLGIAKYNAINCNMISNQDLKNTCKGIVESYV